MIAIVSIGDCSSQSTKRVHSGLRESVVCEVISFIVSPVSSGTGKISGELFVLTVVSTKKKGKFVKTAMTDIGEYGVGRNVGPARDSVKEFVRRAKVVS